MKLTRIVAVLAGLSSPTVVSADREALDAGARALAADHRGAAVAIVEPSGVVSAAAGDADPDGRAMTPDTPIRIASVTKSFTAAAILRLWETGRLDLDAPIGPLVFYADRLDGAAVYRHAGFWGVEALVVPEQRLVIVAAVLNQTGSAGLRDMIDRLALESIQ